jgi:hypothetical protein
MKKILLKSCKSSIRNLDTEIENDGIENLKKWKKQRKNKVEK